MTGLRYYTSLFNQYKVAIYNGSFMDSKVAFQMDQGPFFVSTLKDSKINWGMAKRPMGPVNDGTILMGTGYSITKDSKYPQLAWEWIKFVGTRTENIRRMYEMTNRTPAYIPALSPYAQYMRRQYGDAAAPIMEITANPSNFSGAISPKIDEITPLIQNTLRDINNGTVPLDFVFSIGLKGEACELLRQLVASGHVACSEHRLSIVPPESSTPFVKTCSALWRG